MMTQPIRTFERSDQRNCAGGEETTTSKVGFTLPIAT